MTQFATIKLHAILVEYVMTHRIAFVGYLIAQGYAVNLGGKSGSRGRLSETTNVQMKSTFVDQVLMGVLSQLLGGLSGTSGGSMQDMDALLDQLDSQLTTMYEAAGIPAPDSGAAPAPPGTSVEEEEKEIANDLMASEKAAKAAGMGMESKLAGALTEHDKLLHALKTEVESLKGELSKLDEIGEKNKKAGISDSDPSAIHLTIKYPGMEAKMKKPTEAPALEPEELKEADEEENKGPVFEDPANLRVPVVVVAPKSELNFDKLLAKMIHERQSAATPAGQEAAVEEATKDDAGQRLAFYRKQLKDAEAHVEFFETDLDLTEDRM